MAHFAELDSNNTVIRVIVVNNEVIEQNGSDNEQLGIDFCKSLYGEDTVWKQTSFNANFRYNFGIPNSTYDEDNDAFIDEQPYPSWTLDENYQWQPPIEQPEGTPHWAWNEETQSWDDYEI
jgi:hypothetical protein